MSNLNIYNNNQGNIGIGTDNPTSKLYVNGNINVTGELTQSFSDIRLKTIHSNIKNPLSIIDNLNGFYYKYNDLAKEYGFNDDLMKIGLNAQEVNKVLPEIVKIAPFDLDNNNQSKSGKYYLTISYEKLVPILIEGIKELKKEIIGNLPLLETLDVDHNQISELDNDIFRNTSYLVKLNLSYNMIYYLYYDIFTNLLFLEHLELNNNKLRSLHPYLFYRNYNLENLSLEHNLIIYIYKKIKI